MLQSYSSLILLYPHQSKCHIPDNSAQNTLSSVQSGLIIPSNKIITTYPWLRVTTARCSLTILQHSYHRAKIFISALFSVFTSPNNVVRFHYQGPGSAQQRDRCCQHRDSFAVLAFAFWHGHMWVARGCGCHRL